MINCDNIFSYESLIANKEFFEKFYNHAEKSVNDWLKKNDEFVKQFDAKSDINKDEFMKKCKDIMKKNIFAKKFYIFCISLDNKKIKEYTKKNKTNDPNWSKFYNFHYDTKIDSFNIKTDFYLHYRHGNKRLSIMMNAEK